MQLPPALNEDIRKNPKSYTSFKLGTDATLCVCTHSVQESMSVPILSASEKLLLPYLKAPAYGRVLFLGCGSGTLALELARQNPELDLTLTDILVSALDAARQLFKSHELTQAQIMPPPPVADPGDTFDLVVIGLPQSRALTRRWLCEAQQRLRVGGWLYISGPNELGIKSAITDLKALFGSAQLLGYGKHGRAARAQKQAQTSVPEPGWASEAGIMPGSWYTLDFMLDAQRYTLRSLPGVFSCERLDAGTLLLLDALKLTEGAHVLDAGCGYGPLGIAAALRGAAHVDLLDINMLAAASAHENIGRMPLAQAAHMEVLTCDGLACLSERRYDLIVSNPPFHQGKQTDRSAVNAFIEQGRNLLLPGGRLLLVANVFLRYERELSSLFRQVAVLAENHSFRVIEAKI